MVCYSLQHHLSLDAIAQSVGNASSLTKANSLILLVQIAGHTADWFFDGVSTGGRMRQLWLGHAHVSAVCTESYRYVKWAHGFGGCVGVEPVLKLRCVFADNGRELCFVVLQ